MWVASFTLSGLETEAHREETHLVQYLTASQCGGVRLSAALLSLLRMLFHKGPSQRAGDIDMIVLKKETQASSSVLLTFAWQALQVFSWCNESISGNQVADSTQI